MAVYDMSSTAMIEFLPLTEPVLLILLSLAEQPRHGYSILKDVEEMSDGRVVLSTGTLYGALRRLLDEEWIERIDEEDTSRGRQAYRLTSRGRKNLQLGPDFKVAETPSLRAELANLLGPEAIETVEVTVA